MSMRATVFTTASTGLSYAWCQECRWHSREYRDFTKATAVRDKHVCKPVMTARVANAIYDILMEDCGATDHWRSNFVYWCTKQGCSGGEYRFQGDLGFGGKFRHYHHRPWYVDQYHEDANLDTERMIERANRRLEELGRRVGRRV